jgi:acetyl esterase/lipase
MHRVIWHPRFPSPEDAYVKKFLRRKIKKSTICLTLVLCACALVAAAAEQNVVLLWPNGAPGSEGKTGPEKVRLTPDGEHVISSVHQPTITVYLPPKESATGAAVVIAPGGSHVELWVDHEGYAVAQWLSEHGVAGFVLKYRLAREPGSTYTIDGNSVPDMQRAIRLVRSRAADWGVDPARVGVMGFSAGGDVAARTATQFDAGNPAATDPIDRQDSKPSFQALIYPGLPQDLPVSKDEPPAFLLCGQDDQAGISERLPELFVQLKHAGVPAELHVYTGVGHGFGIRTANPGAIAGWPDRFLEWLGTLGFLKRK